MTKKKGEYSVLSEVNTEEEWLSLCEKEVRWSQEKSAEIDQVNT